MRVALAILLGVAVAVPLSVLTLGTFSDPCAREGRVATLTDALTPWVIADSPLYGEAGMVRINHTGTSTTVTTIMIAENGTVSGWFEYENWTVYKDSTRAGSLAACSSEFVATAVDEHTSIAKLNPPGLDLGFANDSQAPTYIGSNSSGTPVVYYYAGFYERTGTVSTCGTTNRTVNLTYHRALFGLGFEYGGSWHILNETLTIDIGNVYKFPANGGTWAVDNLSAPGGPGGGWSFSYIGPC